MTLNAPASWRTSFTPVTEARALSSPLLIFSAAWVMTVSGRMMPRVYSAVPAMATNAASVKPINTCSNSA